MIEPEIQTELDKLSRDITRLGIDHAKESPFAEFLYADVVFPAADLDVIIRHKFRGKGEVLPIPVKWSFSAAPGDSPALYTVLGVPVGAGYIKVRSTIAGRAVVLLVLRNSEETA